MREEIISILKDKNTMSMDIDTLAKKLSIKNKSELLSELTALVEEGILDYSERKKKYLLFENSHLVKAVIGPTNSEGITVATANGEKYYILKKNLKGATYGDTVSLDVDSNNNGIVVRILKRDDSNYVGEVVSKNNILYVYDKRLGFINIPSNSAYVEGQKVLIRHEDGKNEIIDIIGHKDDPGIDIKSILYDHNFSDEFNEEVMEELNNIPTNLSASDIEEALASGRVDYRDAKIITLDGDDTKDIDDGISIKKLENGGFELKVYIADVSHYVKEGSAIDEEAYTRATSVYPPGSVNPMFDHKISNGICSLNPGVDRLAMCYTTLFDRTGKAIDFKVEEAVIRSKKKMTYSAVNDILVNEEIKEDYDSYLKEIYIMYELSLLINKQFEKNGYLSFISNESKVELNETGIPQSVGIRETGPAQKLIEMFMLITNVELTKYAYYVGLPWVYRIHGEPNQDRLQTTYKILNFKNYINNKEKKKYSSNDIKKTMNALSKYDNAHIFSNMFITCQDKAKYSDENIGHYALGATLYSHNTSPIRRYPDLINQRIVKAFLHYGIDYVLDNYSDLKEMAIHCSIQEREAASIEREATDMKKAEYMQNHIGETHVGYVTFVSRHGLWVVLDNTVEGYVHLTSLPKDKYKYSEEIFSLIGKNHTFTIGDKVEIKVKGADKEAKTIDFAITKELLENEKEEKEVKTKKRVKSL